MAKMMRRRSWVQVSNTYGTDYSGSFRGRDRRETQRLLTEWSDEIDEYREIRELWCLVYGSHPAQYADRFLDLHEIPKPPSRSRRMPG